MAVQQLPWDPWQGINPWQLLLQIAVSVAAAAAVTNCSTPHCQVSQYIDHQASCCQSNSQEIQLCKPDVALCSTRSPARPEETQFQPDQQ
jgi:hypothetical protein